MGTEENGGGPEYTPERSAFVSERLTSPSDVAREAKLAGLRDDNARAGYRSLYLNRDLSRRVDFKNADVLGERAIPEGEPPFTDVVAHEVRLTPGAQVEFMRFRTPPREDDWDLDTQIQSLSRVVLVNECFTEDCPPVVTGMRRTCRCADVGAPDWIGDPEF